MGINQITLISVPVTDQERAKDFYETLGFTVTNDHMMTEEEMPPEPGLRWLQLGAPGGGATIVLANWTGIAARSFARPSSSTSCAGRPGSTGPASGSGGRSGATAAGVMRATKQ